MILWGLRLIFFWGPLTRMTPLTLQNNVIHSESFCSDLKLLIASHLRGRLAVPVAAWVTYIVRRETRDYKQH